MRAVFGMASVLIVLAIVAVVAKNQLVATRQAVPVLGVPAPQGSPTLAVNPDASVKAQSQQIQQQYKQALESALQTPRLTPDDSEKP